MMNNYVLDSYDMALERILDYGEPKTNKRTGQKTISLPSMDCKYDLRLGYPFLTRRKISFKAMVAELLWFIEGSTSLDRLKELGCNYWEPWRSEEFEEENGYVAGALGPVYGFQLRSFDGNYMYGLRQDYNLEGLFNSGTDQLKWLLDAIKEDPSDRGLVVTLWNPEQLGEGRLRPCAWSFQVLINDVGYMDLILNQRSADFPVGVPFNIAFYSLLLTLIAEHTGYSARYLIHKCSDSHIYVNQIDAVEQYLDNPRCNSPFLDFNKRESLFDYEVGDFSLIDYNPGPKINFPVAV
jgi:thymidylate synthase